MSYSTFLEAQNKNLRNSLYEWQEMARQYRIIIDAKDKRIAELESQVTHWKSNRDEQLKVKRQLLDRPDLQDRAASIQKLQDKIDEQNKLIGDFMQLAENSIDCIETLKTHIQDLETQNKILTETGHWIGQDEAYDLKAAVKKFLDMTRLGRILDEETTIWEVPCWQMDELSKALRDSKFKGGAK